MSDLNLPGHDADGIMGEDPPPDADRVDERPREPDITSTPPAPD